MNICSPPPDKKSRTIRRKAVSSLSTFRWYPYPARDTRRRGKKQSSVGPDDARTTTIVPFGVTYEKIGTIQRRLAWPLHKDDTLSQSGRPTGLNIYFCAFP